MSKSLCRKSAPQLRTIKLLGHINCDIEVTAFNSQLKSSPRILHELQGNFGISFLLEISDNALANQTRRLDEVKHFIVISLDEREFEAILSRVNFQDPRLRVAVQAIHVSSLDPDEVHGLVQSSHDTIVPTRLSTLENSKLSNTDLPIQKRVFDVIQSGIKKHAGIVPSGALDPNRLMQSAYLFQSFGDDRHVVFAQQSRI